MITLLVALGFTVPLAILAAVVYFIFKSAKGLDDKNSLTIKEVSVDFGLFITLVATISSIISIVFSAIDKKFADVLSTNIYYPSNVMNDDIRVAVSVVLVVFPLYLALAYYKAKKLSEDKDRLSIPAIRYVNYFIVVVSGLFIIGSLISTIYQYLGGDLGAAFAYKVLTVVVIAVALFVYNYYTLKRNYSKKTWLPHAFALISLIAVVASVIYSVNILGSPAMVRKIKFDEKRLTDLSNIQQQILNSWQQNKVLPENLNMLAGDGFNYGFTIPVDPETKKPYDYKIVTNSEMVKAEGQACATFYPGKFGGVVPTPMIYAKDGTMTYSGTSYDVSKLTCMIPTKAVFEICASFNTVRAYDENGVDQSGAGWDSSNDFGVRSLAAPTAMSSKYYEPIYYDTFNRNPNWNHDAAYTCFKRTIDPLKYPSWN